MLSHAEAVLLLIVTGNLRDDIWKCKQAAAPAVPPTPFPKMSGQQSTAVAARQLGRHYLQRYFYLLAVRAYLTADPRGTSTFARWFAERAELKHLLSTMAADVAL